MNDNTTDTSSGDDAMTDAQRVYLDKLASQVGEPTPPEMNRFNAAKKIEELRGETTEESDVDSDFETRDNEDLSKDELIDGA